MSMQCSVLCPDGHRVPIKMNRQTPLLTILEEACGKRKLDPAKHAIRRENDRPNVPNLDCSLTIGFAGLSNHCKLEVVQCAQSAVQKVKIALQLENGGRVIGEYSSEDTLDKMLEKAQSKLEGNIPNGHEPVVIYMRKEIVGLENLSKTSLKMLGLAGGSAVLRLIHRNPESLVDQANVVNISTPALKDENQEKDNWRPMRNEESNPSLKMFEKAKEKESENNIPKPSTEDKMEVEEIESKCEKQPKQVEKTDTSKDIITENNEDVEVTKNSIEKSLVEPPIINVLDENHHTVIYKLSDQSARIRANIGEVSDDFFDLTIQDAKVLLRDARKMQKELDSDGKILMTQQMREAQKEGEKLSLLNKYKRSVIRVQLPDRHIVQGFYHPGAKLNEVIENLQRNLKLKPEDLYELFITPPKQVLDPNESLLDLGLVPAALVYLSVANTSTFTDTLSLMSDENILSNSSGAEKVLTEARVLRRDFTPESIESEAVQMTSTSASTSEASNNTSGSSKNDQAIKRPPTTSPNEKTGNNKVPKWFRTSK